MSTKRLNIYPGKKFGKLTIIKEIPKTNNKRKFLCRCVCGNLTEAQLDNMRSGHTKSCGCLSSQTAIKVHSTHGLTKTRLHGIWAGMLARCRNPNVKSYKDYGARGISVCQEWLNNFQCFHDWAMLNGYADNLTIERINNDGNYEPSNCSWVTRKEQRYNRRDTARSAYA